jgi:hypothetical protein
MSIVGEVPSAPLDQRAADRLVTSQPMEIAPALAPRTCGRCRGLFEGDPTLHAAAIAEWWACDACRASLGLKPNPTVPSC